MWGIWEGGGGVASFPKGDMITGKIVLEEVSRGSNGRNLIHRSFIITTGWKNIWGRKKSWHIEEGVYRVGPRALVLLIRIGKEREKRAIFIIREEGEAQRRKGDQ